MKGGSVAGLPVLCVVSPSRECRPPFRVCWVALLNGGVVCAVMPCLWIGSGALHCPAPSRIVESPFSLCICCHSIVGLGVCLCDRVVSLWNSGDGLRGSEGRVVSTVHCQLLCVVVCVSVWRVCCFVVLCCGMAVRV